MGITQKQVSAMTEVQHERAYLKQSHIGTAQLKGIFKKRTPGKDGYRYYKNVGLGFKTPREAIEGTYIDKKCPFTGDVSIRGRILQGVVKSTKMNRTIIIRKCRPLSKTVRFNVLKVIPAGSKAVKGFSSY